ncbi:MAG: hypothetical protein R2712_18575 [Vicinamibacterales bacterium]
MHHHARGLRALLDRERLPAADAEALVSGLLADTATGAGLTAREQALLAYAELLTRTPWSVTRADVAPLRAAGLDDRGIHDACAVVSYFAFVNRIADGLGVELERADPASIDDC